MPAARASARRRRPKRKTAGPKLSPRRPPAELPVAEWQRRLRRQFGREQAFEMRNIGGEPVFSEFEITNPKSGRSYRVAIRGANPGDSFCSCPDFATNDLGTCKHVEFTLSRLERKRGGKAALARGFRPPYSEIYVRYGGERRVCFRRGAECPETLAKRAAALFRGPDAEVPPERFAKLDRFLADAQKSRHEVRCYEDALRLVAQVRDAEARRRMLDAAYPDGARSEGLATLLAARLYPYQSEGALFAARAGRCLIGDEMGLGKTVQAIAAVEIFARHFGAERVLVVCPTSLKHQWQREIGRFTSRDARVVGGLRAARVDHYRAPGFCKIANYESVAKDVDLIEAWSPDVVIVDEAQRIKNWNTKAARTLKRIASPYAIVLTGTPLENRLEELISIVQFVDQHRLGPTWKLQHEHQIRDDLGRVVGYRALDRLGATLAPILLRRRKAEVLRQLPERVDNTVFVQMTAEQWRHHEENREIVARIVARWRRIGFLTDTEQRMLQCALQNMRMACNSTYLLDCKTDDCTKADELMTLLEELFEQPDAKAVVFSQWLRTHELIARRLESRRWGHVMFNGSVPSDKRGELIARFGEDPHCRVFLSTDAGGVGLNLQHAASTVVNMDLPWNPAVLEQRIGRVHRLGQTRGVQVVNFVAEGTIEEGMLSVLAFKESLFAGVLDGGESEVFLGGSRLSQFMERVEAAAGSAGKTPHAILPEARQATSPEAARAATPPEAARPATPPEAAGPADALEAARASVTESPEAAADSAAPAPARAHPVPKDTETATAAQSAAAQSAATSPSDDPWVPLLTAGLKLVELVAAASGAAGASAASAASAANGGNGASGTAGRASPSSRPSLAGPTIETDAGTGRSYLKLPLPEPQAVRQLHEALSNLLAGLTR